MRSRGAVLIASRISVPSPAMPCTLITQNGAPHGPISRILLPPPSSGARAPAIRPGRCVALSSARPQDRTYGRVVSPCWPDCQWLHKLSAGDSVGTVCARRPSNSETLAWTVRYTGCGFTLYAVLCLPYSVRIKIFSTAQKADDIQRPF